MKFDDILEKLGEFGTYQKRVFFLLGLPSISIGSFCFMTIVLLYTPDHRCKIPDIDNDTYTIQDDHHLSLINRSIPLSNDPTIYYDRCNVYVADGGGGLVNVDGENRPTNASKQQCKEWVYDSSIFVQTFTSKINLVCADSLKTSHIQVFFYFGLLVGDIVLGVMADMIGRQKTLCLSLTLLLVSSTGVMFVSEFFTFAILEFIIGGTAHGAFLCISVLCVEIVGPSRRVWMSIFMQIFFACGGIYLAGMSYFLRDWKWINLTCVVPCVVYLAYWWFVPESPRWLISQGRQTESEIIIKKVASANKVVLTENMQVTRESKYESETAKLWHLLKSPVLLRRTMILSFNWMIVSMTYYGVTMNAGNMGGNFYLNFLLMGLVEIPGYVAVIVLMDRIGRRKCNSAFMIIAGVACLGTVPAVLFISGDMHSLIILLALVGKAGSAAAFGVVFVFTGELLPTVVRNAAMGMCSCAARLGAMLAPYVAKSGEMIGGKFGQVEPLLIFGALSIVAGGLALLLPETLNETLPDTMQEGIEFGRKRSKESTKEDTEANKDTETPFLS